LGLPRAQKTTGIVWQLLEKDGLWGIATKIHFPTFIRRMWD
jgi:hypothetical protein